MPESIDLSPADLELVKSILKSHVPEFEVRAFGSRVTWLAKEYSDLDLAIMTDKPLPISRTADLREAFTESNLPIKVDLVDWAAIGESFRKIIEKGYVVVQTKSEKPSFIKSDVKNEWRSSTWGEEISLEYGKSLRNYDVPNGKYRVFGSNGPVGWTDKALAQGPGIILGRKGAYRGVQYSPDPFFVIDTAYYVVPKKEYDMRWLYYAIQHYKLGEIDDGSPIPSTTRAAVYMTDLEVPPVPQQHAVAQILGALDDKIELNRKTNETLETMARALFKSWFVDFDPVRAKVEGRDTGLPKEIADLFPDEFQGSELGEIPKGWCVVPLIQAIEVNPFRPLHKGDVAPYLDMANMPTTTARANGIIERVFGSGMRFIQGDTLVARITPCLENGKTCFVDFLDENKIGWGSTEYIVFRSKPPLPLEFSYFLARTDNFRSFAISNMTGTSGRQRVPADCFNQYLMVLPSTKVTETFGQISSSVMRQMKINDKQSQTLVSNRDLLLLKLISGEIDIRNFENESKVIFK